MPETGTSGSVGALGEQSPGATRPFPSVPAQTDDATLPLGQQLFTTGRPPPSPLPANPFESHSIGFAGSSGPLVRDGLTPGTHSASRNRDSELALFRPQGLRGGSGHLHPARPRAAGRKPQDASRTPAPASPAIVAPAGLRCPWLSESLE